ncbi:single-stranded-DNA-specific exonuclease RecJ [Candidatus Saccharibacteria bacterium]|nr:single-stranded-DNA-specific exonuclease RecJ [Candidatus Saccharibacteria bacterium]
MSRIFEEIIKKRGLDEAFLNPKYLSDEKIHEKMPDIKKAVDRIIKAISSGEKIMVYGDYDVDGVTATTVMVDALRLAGASEVVTMLPDRFIDGYGMSKRCVEKATSVGVSLVVTVDCGSNNSAVISELSKKGIDTVVTDHHEVMAEIPEDAVAVVNPKRTDISKKAQKAISDAGLNELAGVGVAFMIARAMVSEGKIPEGQEKWMLDLVLIGTLCDSMKIAGVNRELTFFGKKVLEKTRRVGLIELMRVAKMTKITSEAIGFQIGPRLNAGGRMESAEISLGLLMTSSKTEAVRLAEELNNLNTERRNEQMAAMDEIAERCSEELLSPVIVVSGEWHEGVLGIIAGRLVEKYHKPAFVLSKVSVSDVDGDGFSDVYKGSGRSFGEFNLAEAILNCSDFASGGGHAAACGVRVAPDKLDGFKKAVNKYYESLKLKNQERFLEVEAEISEENLSDFSEELLDELSSLEPFGEGNREPIFELKNVEVIEARGVGKDGKHLRMVVQDGDYQKMTLVSFFAPDEWMEISVGEKMNVKVQLMRNEWNGRVFVEGRILGID